MHIYAYNSAEFSQHELQGLSKTGQRKYIWPYL